MANNNYDRLDNSGLLYLTQQLKTKMLAMIPGVFSGADGTNAGSAGQVPAPAATDNNKFLKGDGTWAAITIPTVPIESISVNSVPVTPDTNKNVDIVVPTKVSDLTNDSNFQDATQVSAAIAAAITIEQVQVNGSALTPDQNKAVNIIVPTNVSDLTNDSDFISSSAVDSKIATALTSTYKAGGSLANIAALPQAAAAHEGYVYNIESAFTTTSDFVEGAGHSYPAGTNVGIVNVGTVQTPSYKYDVMAGFVDLSGYVQASEMSTVTNAQIDTIIQQVFG